MSGKGESMREMPKVNVVTSDKTTLQIVRLEDLPDVTSVHLNAFPRSALSGLGREAVRRYYEWQLVGPHDRYAVVAMVDGQIAGFNFAGVSRGAISGFVRKNRNWLAMRVLLRPWLMVNPMVRTRIRTGLEVLGLRRRTVQSPSPVARPKKSFGILSIAVDPGFQGCGVAQLLMEDAEREAREWGFKYMYLTVATDNLRAIRFYEKTGWTRVPQDGEFHGFMDKWLDLPGSEEEVARA